MKRIARDGHLTPEEAAEYNAVRRQIEQEKPEINARIRNRMAGTPKGGGSMALTYREMLKLLQAATNEQLDQDAMVYCRVLDEFSLVDRIGVSVGPHTKDSADGVLDEGHLYLEING